MDVYFLNRFKKLFLNLMAICFKTCLLIDDNYIDNFVTRKILEGGNFAGNDYCCPLGH